MAISEDNSAGVQVIARAAAILRCLKNESGGLSLGQIAERVRLPRSTVQRIVAALQTENLVIGANPGRGIRLGPEITSLAQAGHIDMAEIFRPYLVDLARETGETIDLAVLRGNRLIFIDQIPGSHRLRTVSSVGESFPLFTTANGKACLALLDRDKRKELIVAEFGESAGAAVEKLTAEIEKISKSKVAYDIDEHTVGISAIGSAVVDLSGDIYAVSIPIPSARFANRKADVVVALAGTIKKLSELEVVDRI